jgi:hypothetical protein
MPWSIETESAFVTAPQFKTDEPPAVIVAGDALKDAILGVPLQPVCAGGCGVGVRVGGTGVRDGVADGTMRFGVADGGIAFDARVTVGGTGICIVAVISVVCGVTGASVTFWVQSAPTHTNAISDNAEPAELNACAWM